MYLLKLQLTGLEVSAGREGTEVEMGVVVQRLDEGLGEDRRDMREFLETILELRHHTV